MSLYSMIDKNRKKSMKRVHLIRGTSPKVVSRRIFAPTLDNNLRRAAFIRGTTSICLRIIAIIAFLSVTICPLVQNHFSLSLFYFSSFFLHSILCSFVSLVLWLLLWITAFHVIMYVMSKSCEKNKNRKQLQSLFQSAESGSILAESLTKT